MPKFDVDADLVRKLAELLGETDLGEIEYEAEGRRIRVARPQGGSGRHAPAEAPPPPPPAAAIAPAPEPADTQPAGAVTSPMVGTVYLSASPGEPPFASEGDSVVAGETLMLVEAMKTFNEIKAPHAGRLSSILVENGQPVEYGETLAIIG